MRSSTRWGRSGGSPPHAVRRGGPAALPCQSHRRPGRHDGHLTARFQRTANGKQLSVWVNEVVHHRLAAAAVSTDALLVHRSRLDFGGIGIDDHFNVREGIRKDDEPTTQMILYDAPSVLQCAYSLCMSEADFGGICCAKFG